MKKILMRTSIRGNKYGNCSNLEEGCNEPLFDLKWRKTPVVPQQVELMTQDETDLAKISQLLDEETSMSYYKDNVLSYIGGFIVKKILNSISCNECADALLEKNNRKRYYLSLTNIKNSNIKNIRGQDVVKIFQGSLSR